MTTREWINSPNATVNTILGPVSLTPTSDEHIHVSSGNNGKDPISVNGVHYYVSLHLQIKEGRVSVLAAANGSTYGSLYMTRMQSTTFSKHNATDPARNRASMILVAAAQRWVDQNPDILKAAKVADTTQRAIRLEGEIADLEAKLAPLRAELAALGV